MVNARREQRHRAWVIRMGVLIVTLIAVSLVAQMLLSGIDETGPAPVPTPASS